MSAKNIIFTKDTLLHV